jgi:uncharacterized protein with GYD domain
MPTYVSLINWTDQGVKNFKDTVDRAAQAEEAMGKLGVTFKAIYWTIGSYDIVGIVEADDEESATAALLAVASQGNIRTTTLRAFNRDEMGNVIAKLAS